MTRERPRTYKYQLTTEKFKFASTATGEEFAVRADEMRSKGVERLTGAEIFDDYGTWR